MLRRDCLVCVYHPAMCIQRAVAAPVRVLLFTAATPAAATARHLSPLLLLYLTPINQTSSLLLVLRRSKSCPARPMASSLSSPPPTPWYPTSIPSLLYASPFSYSYPRTPPPSFLTRLISLMYNNTNTCTNIVIHIYMYILNIRIHIIINTALSHIYIWVFNGKAKYMFTC